ncbi:carbohydrate-binding domain-containing protein [Nigerium massiliense]|uniref:carbohydrate-binding domain-containing protein n=1 Tax=Nigerium massiliense TaxID=1522317 RepID=UPI0012FD4973|nr:carbohydrate-binding domain-containing protein [Nigerium massiliense]
MAVFTVAPLLAASSLAGVTPAQAADPLVIRAKADLANNKGAEVEVRLNGADVGRFTVNSTVWTDYTLLPSSGPKDGDRIDIRFANDGDPTGGDRNLWVDSVAVGTQRLSPTDADVTYDRGAGWAAATDGASVVPGQKLMPWDGALRFTWRSSTAKAVSVEDPVDTSAQQPFASSSFWYQRIPTNVALSERGATYRRVLAEDIASHDRTATINTSGYAPPVYRVNASTPRVKVRNNQCTGPNGDPAWLERMWAPQFDSVPIPAEAKAASGADQEIVIWSPSTNEVWEMWRFESNSGAYQACWGGKFSATNTSNGVHPYPFGVTASGLSLLGGTVRVAELRAGRINHAVAIGVNRPRKGVHSWPANRDDGTWDSVDAIPEGQRFRLDPSVDVQSLNLSPIGMIIARAAQEYGFVVRDNTTGPVVVYAEDADPYVRAGKGNPYTEMFGSQQHLWMNGFPWDRLQALPMDYGKP